jgi:hypothetical protein
MMSDNIVRLMPKPEPKPPQEAINLLSDMIHRMESGEVVEVGIAAVTKDGGLSTCWHGWAGSLIAPVHLLAARLMDDMR